MNSHEVETEALFYRLLYSYLLQRPSLKDNYKILCEQYKQYKESFKKLRKPEILWLKKIQEDIENDKYSLFSNSLNLTNPIPDILKKEKSEQRHRDLCREIVKKKEILIPFVSNIDKINIEHPTLFGPIDLIVYNNKLVYIIELKTKSADHSIIGQVMKYYIGMCLKLILKLFDEIKIITLCPGYDQASYQGLKQIGVTPLLINDNPLRISDLK